VIKGERFEINLESVPPLTPRQLNMIAGGAEGLEAGISRWVAWGLKSGKGASATQPLFALALQPHAPPAHARRPACSLPSPPRAGGSAYTLQSMSAEYLTQVICSSELPQPREFTLRHRAL
jgi:hypothetical protein